MKRRLVATFLLVVILFALNLTTSASNIQIPVYGLVLNSAVAVAQRYKLNFVGGGCVDNPGTASTDCTIPGTAQLHSVGFVIDGGGAQIALGDAKVYPTSAAAGTITRIDISADQSCSVTVDVWKAPGAIPVAGNKISASAPLTLSTAQLAQNGSRTGWSTSVAVGDVWGFSVITVTTCTRVLGQVWYQ